MSSDRHVENNKKLTKKINYCMHHWFGDKMSLKAEEQIKVSGMSVKKCGEFGRLEERCGEGDFESSHLELASITLISLSLSLACAHILSLLLAFFFSLSDLQ